MKNLVFVRLSLLGLLLSASACSDSASVGAVRFALDTLPNDRVVARNADVTGPPRWRLVERLRLGSALEEGPSLFGAIGGLAIGDGGEIYVLDSQAAEVRAFSADGTFLRSFGGGGEGPGELANPTGLVWGPEGDLWVLNWSNARYSSYTPSTGEVGREPRRRVSFAQFPWPGRFDVSGRLVDIGLDGAGRTAALRLGEDFVPSDTITLPQPYDDALVTFSRGGQMIASMPEPFAPQPVWAPRPRGGIVVGEGRAYRLHRISFGGDTTLTVEVDRPLAPVAPEEADSAMARFRQMAESLGGATPDRQPSSRETKPAHGGLFVDDQDRTWVVAILPGGLRRWDLFAPDGRLLGQVESDASAGYRLPAVRGSLVAMATEVDGVPSVIVYEMVEGD
ncbi:MAG: hypothetical protein HKN72_02570 [Gemmatimonadetes bacterium]|nr:hypothetical protein [Gemmatimonadota bacterium]